MFNKKPLSKFISSSISNMQGENKMEKKKFIFNMREKEEIQSQTSNSGSATNHLSNFLGSGLG